MFECDCESGYELSDNGYDCYKPPKNISHPFNESKSDEDYSISDVFYQKGVSFSAKLEQPNEVNLPSSNDVNVLLKNTKTEVDNQRFALFIPLSFHLHTNVCSNYSKLSTNIIKSTPKSLNIPRFYQTSWLAFRPLKGKFPLHVNYQRVLKRVVVS